MAFPADQSQKRRIVVPATGAGADVTLPIRITEACLQQIPEIFDADGPNPAQDGGGDIRFSSDGTTQIACDVRRFETDNDPANGKCEIWAPHTATTASASYLWIHWGTVGTSSQPAADSTYGSEAVYPSSALAYWNMDQDPSGSAPQILDATSNDRHATSQGSMTSGDLVDAAVGKGLDFDGTNDALTASVTGIGATLTQEVVVTTPASFTAGMNRYVMDMGPSPTGNVCWFQIYDDNSDGVPQVWAGYSVAGTSYASSGFSLATSTTYHIVVTRNSTTKTQKIYVNGDLKKTSVFSNSGTPVSVNIGRYNGAGAFFTNNNISLASIWNTDQAAAWAAVRHATLLSPGTFAAAEASGSPWYYYAQQQAAL